MNINQFDIQLDKKSCMYEPGEVINGQVLTCLENPKSARGLKIKIKGKCRVQWERTKTVRDHNGNRRTHRETLTASKRYMDWTEYLIGCANGPNMELPAGEQSYPFSFQLPQKIPATFEHKYGSVIYTLKAAIDLSFRIDPAVTKRFTVVSNLDLNTVRGAAKGIHDERTVSFCNIFCCSSGEMDVKVTLPVRGYVPGQNIEARVCFDNRSEVEIEKIKLNFIQMIKFKVPNESEIKKENKILGNNTLYGPFDQSGEYDVSILVRSVPVSYFCNCKLIDIDYEFNVKYVISGCHSDVSNDYPIFIGTIPLISAQSNWSTASVPVEATEPSAPYLPGPELPIAPYALGPEVPSAPYPLGPADRPVPINYQPMPQNYKLEFENYKPGAGKPVTGMPFVVPAPGPSALPIGFVAPPDFPPPSYEESTRGSHPVDQKQEPTSGDDVK